MDLQGLRPFRDGLLALRSLTGIPRGLRRVVVLARRTLVLVLVVQALLVLLRQA